MPPYSNVHSIQCTVIRSISALAYLMSLSDNIYSLLVLDCCAVQRSWLASYRCVCVGVCIYIYIYIYIYMLMSRTVCRQPMSSRGLHVASYVACCMYIWFTFVISPNSCITPIELVDPRASSAMMQYYIQRLR